MDNIRTGECEVTQLTYLAISGYRVELEQEITRLLEEGRREVTQDELAERLGRKVTQSFRRRVSELQRDGIVCRYSYRTEHGGYKIAYQITSRLTR